MTTAELLGHLIAGLPDRVPPDPREAAARHAFACRLAGGAPVTEALAALCETNERVRRTLFGAAELRLQAGGRLLVASREGQHLCVRDDAAVIPRGPASGDVVFLEARGDGLALEGSRPGGWTLATFTTASALDTIAFHGSLWEAVFPSHHALAVETIALSFPHLKGERLFSGRPGSETSEPVWMSGERLACFANEHTEILSLDAFCRTFSGQPRGPSVDDEHRTVSTCLRRYTTARSAIFDFGSLEAAVTRDDFVVTYVDDGREDHREFVVCPDRWPREAADLQLATFDLLNMLAIRRAKLFRSDFAKRVYNVLFPPLIASTGKGRDSAAYAIFPCLNLYRGERSGFRRTASLSFTIVPIRQSGRSLTCASRRASLRELHRLKSALEQSALASRPGLGGFRLVSAAGGYYQGLHAEAPLLEQLLAIATDVARRAYGGAAANASSIGAMLSSARQEARVTTLLLQVEWRPPTGSSQPWESWLAEEEDETFKDALYRTLFYGDFLFPQRAYASRRAAQLREFSVGNTLGADMTGMTLFNPQERLKVCLYSAAFESYPNYSIIRWATWQIYIDSALTSMRALICKFHPIMDSSGSLQDLMVALRQMLREFVEFYDLDIREYFYRKEYEKLRERMQVEADYRQLREKFAAAKEDELLREQRLINKLIVALTVATVTISIISTLAQMNKLTVSGYIWLSVLAAGVLTPFGYALFDPVKLGYDRTRRMFDPTKLSYDWVRPVLFDPVKLGYDRVKRALDNLRRSTLDS